MAPKAPGLRARRLWAATKASAVQALELQYAADCLFPEELQTILTMAVKAYSRLGLSVNITKTAVIGQ